MLTSHYLGLPQRRVAEFLQIGQMFKDMVSEVPGNAMKQITGNTIEALSSFIESEVTHRQAERYKALKLYPDRTKSLASQGTQLNEEGLVSMVKTLKSLDSLKADVGKLKPDKLKKKIAVYQADIRSRLAETELKVSDIEKLDALINDSFTALSDKGIDGLVEHMQAGADKLNTMRRQPDRGLIGNFPAWKIGGLIILLGLAIIAYIHCGIFGCSIETRNSYIVAWIVTALVTLGC